jgi:uncharacterized protein (UPF0335 family)
MKKIQTVVAMKIKGRPIEIFIDGIERLKSVNFKIDENLYRKFEHVVGRGNVSEVIRKFMKAVVRKYEKMGNFDFLRGYEHGKKQKQGKG